MKIGIIGAMKQEVILLQKKIEKCTTEITGTHTCHIGYLHGINIVLIESGIGKVAASISTTILLTLYKVDIIFSIGTAGSISSKLHIGDIIIPNKTCYYDVDLKIFNYDIGQIPHHPTFFIINKKLLLITQKCVQKLNYRYQEGLIITGDSFIHNKDSLILIKNNFPLAIAVEMESTAIAQTCYNFNTPFLIIRVISDSANKNSIHDFSKYIHLASYRVKKIIDCILKKIDISDIN